MHLLKALLRFLEIPNSEQREFRKLQEERLRRLGVMRTPWRYSPRYKKILFVLAWVLIIAAAVWLLW